MNYLEYRWNKSESSLCTSSPCLMKVRKQTQFNDSNTSKCGIQSLNAMDDFWSWLKITTKGLNTVANQAAAIQQMVKLCMYSKASSYMVFGSWKTPKIRAFARRLVKIRIKSAHLQGFWSKSLYLKCFWTQFKTASARSTYLEALLY